MPINTPVDNRFVIDRPGDLLVFKIKDPRGLSYDSEAIDIYVNGSTSHIIGLSIRFNLFRDGRTKYLKSYALY